LLIYESKSSVWFMNIASIWKVKHRFSIFKARTEGLNDGSSPSIYLHLSQVTALKFWKWLDRAVLAFFCMYIASNSAIYFFSMKEVTLAVLNISRLLVILERACNLFACV